MIGKTIGHYKIVDKLGEGGMGAVYKAEDTTLHRLVALKALSSQLAENEEARERFVREAEAASKLNHPNITTIHELLEEEGEQFIAMEYVEGETIREMVEKGEVPIRKAVDIITQAAEALEAAHNKGILHRDVKSANIMVSMEDRVKVMDFGLVHLEERSQLTRTGTTLGTLAYSCPERITAQQVDRCSEIFSLGVVFYELLTGELPFQGESEAKIIYSIINDSPVPPTELRPDIPSELEQIIFKCLAKQPANRYQFAQALISDLKDLKKSLERPEPEAAVEVKEKPAVRKETERRHVTVMFIEFSGYTGMLEIMDPEEVASVMGQCFRMGRSVVEKYGGRKDRLTGNSFRALFGVPEAIENAPQKAINAAIELRNELYNLKQKENLPAPLDIQIGVNSGVVIAGTLDPGDESDYSVIGDTVNLASQLMELAPEGQIYVGPATYRYTKIEFEYIQLKPIVLEGRKEPVPVFELLSTREKVYGGELDLDQIIHSEMVGRDKELEKLEFHVHKVINGEGSIVSVTGEAGVGKSRLVAELRNKDLLQQVTLLEGRCLSIGKNLSYHPIIDVLKTWANIREEDTESEAASLLEKAISDIYPDGAGEVFPFIATLMGMKLTGEHAQQVKRIEGESLEKFILKSFRDLIIMETELRPIVFIVHDIHWADISSIELLESLYRLAENHAIFFINVFRPNHKDTSDRILGTLRVRYSNYHSEIYLEPLDEAYSNLLLRNLLRTGDLPADTQKAITDRAEGNPFFIEEVARSLVDEGAVELKDGGFRITDRIDSVVIPETIQDILMTRIDRLDEKTRTLLKEASVIGRYFFRRILNRATQATDNINEHLEFLKGIQFIRERTRLDEIEYLFKHALLHEVTYESILLKKRKLLHLNVARVIESVFSERLHEFFGMLAMHYSKAEHYEKAEEYLVKAGEESLKAAASNEAITYFREALNLYLKTHADSADPHTIATLEENIAIAFYNKGYMPEAVDYFDSVATFWGEKRSKYAIVTLINFLVNLLGILKTLYLPAIRAKQPLSFRGKKISGIASKRTEALSYFDHSRFFTDSISVVRMMLKSDLSKIERGASYCCECSVLFSGSGFSLKIGKKLLDYASSYISSEDIRSLIHYKFARYVYVTLSGFWKEEIDYDENLVDNAIQLGEFFCAPATLIWSSLLKTEQGDINAAQMYIDKLHELSEIYENDWFRGRKHFISTNYLLKFRRLSDAQTEAEKGVSLLIKLGQDTLALRVIGMKANILLLLGDINGAEQALEQAGHIVAKAKRTAPFYISNYILSQFILDIHTLSESIHRQSTTEIHRLKKKARHSGFAALKTSKKYAPHKTETFKLMGIYYWLIEKQRRALAWWDRSIEVGEQLGALPELARTYMEVGKRLLEDESKYEKLNGIRADEYLEKAHLLFEEMKLNYDLNELNKIKIHL